jgi:hypothetical protein
VTATNVAGNASASAAGVGPITAAAVTPFDLDGTPVGYTNNSPPTTISMPALSTTYGNNINILTLTSNGGPLTGPPTDTMGNTYTKLTDNGTNLTLWYAKVSTPQSGNVVSFTITNSNFTSVSLFSISGAKFSAPFDPNIPSGVSGITGAPVSITTTNANDILIGSHVPQSGNAAAVSPWLPIFSSVPGGVNDGAFFAVEYQKVTSPQTGTPLNFTDNTTYRQIGVALVKGP